MSEFPGKFGFSVSHTTRKPRQGEENGREYHFVTREAFEILIRDKTFVEHTTFNGNYYGTSFGSVKTVIESGKICILDIEMEGVKSLKKSDLQPYYLSVQPPSLEALNDRLRKRGSETEESILARLKSAVKEIEFSKQPGVFDGVIINDNLDKAYEQLKGFITKNYPL